MAKEEAVEAMAKVLETRPNAMFRAFRNGCATFYSHFSGDRVLVELSPYDLDRGRITYRYK